MLPIIIVLSEPLDVGDNLRVTIRKVKQSMATPDEEPTEIVVQDAIPYLQSGSDVIYGYAINTTPSTEYLIMIDKIDSMSVRTRMLDPWTVTSPSAGGGVTPGISNVHVVSWSGDIPLGV